MEEQFTVQISTKLIDRLTSEGGKPKKRPKKPKSKIPHAPQPSPIEAPPPAGWSPLPPLFMPLSLPPPAVEKAELDAIRSVLRESESIVERLRKQEENMAEEVTQRAKELREKEFKLPYQKPTPCLAEKDACLECYKEHTKDPLKCADAVKTFADCARKVRQQVTTTVAN